MATVQVEMEAAVGVIYVDCTILTKRGEEYFVRFESMLGMEEMWVDRDRLKFPAYADYATG